jgi:hypothetical protein
MTERATAAREHMPFKGHRSCDEWAIEPKVVEVSHFPKVSPRNRRLIEQSERLVGRWR